MTSSQSRLTELAQPRSADVSSTAPLPATVNQLCQELAQNGIVCLPMLIDSAKLEQMQQAFRTRLRSMNWNNVDGYEKTEPYRHMVEHVLTLDQGFVDVALHPLITSILDSYLGETYQLVE